MKNLPCPRGRPKTFNRDALIQYAMMNYWKVGPTGVSINQICEGAGVSKPSLYREFGNEAGLKMAALDAYNEHMLGPLRDLLARDQHISITFRELIEMVTTDRQEIGLPYGCLHAQMHSHHSEFGAELKTVIHRIRNDTIKSYQKRIARAKSKDEFRSNVSVDRLGLFLSTQVVNAIELQKEGYSAKEAEEFLNIAISVFDVNKPTAN